MRQSLLKIEMHGLSNSEQKFIKHNIKYISILDIGIHENWK